MAVSGYADARDEKDPEPHCRASPGSPHNIQPVVTAVARKAAFYRGHNDMVEQTPCAWPRRSPGPAEPRDAAFGEPVARYRHGGDSDAVFSKKTPLTPDRARQIREHPAVAAQFLEQCRRCVISRRSYVTT